MYIFALDNIGVTLCILPTPHAYLLCLREQILGKACEITETGGLPSQRAPKLFLCDIVFVWNVGVALESFGMHSTCIQCAS